MRPGDHLNLPFASYSKTKQNMAAAPAKPYRISPEGALVTTNNITPKRASYQSPTKASLSRSHPEILNRSHVGSRSTDNNDLLFSSGNANSEVVANRTLSPIRPETYSDTSLYESSEVALQDQPKPSSVTCTESSTVPHGQSFVLLSEKTLSQPTVVTPARATRSQQPPPMSKSDSEQDRDIERDDPKSRARAELQRQLDDIQANLNKLENALVSLENNSQLDLDLLCLILQATKDSSLTIFNPINDPVALDASPIAFLRAMVPADLRLTTSTQIFRVLTSIHQVTTLNVCAPQPWPTTIFDVTVKVTCDVETKRVLTIADPKVQPIQTPGIKELRSWMIQRLKNPLHKVNVSTLLWALGLWWEECVLRAQYFYHFSRMTIVGSGDDGGNFRLGKRVDHSDIKNLIQFMEKPFIELIAAESYSNNASTNEARKWKQARLLLKWDITLDWAGEVHSEIALAGTMMSAKGQEGLKSAFTELRKRKGLDAAVTHVVHLCRELI